MFTGTPFQYKTFRPQRVAHMITKGTESFVLEQRTCKHLQDYKGDGKFCTGTAYL